MASFGDKLRSLREQHDLTQEDLGKLLNVKKAAISKYETDKVSINLDSITLLCKHFSVPLSYFIADDTSDFNNASRLPILGTIRAGLPILADENIEGYMEVPENLSADYILRIQGDSMIGAGILDGDLAICREANVPQSGQIIVALRDEGSLSEATLKFYMNGNGHPSLRAANPVFADIDYKDGYRTAGVMVALVRKEAPGYQVYKNYLATNDSDEWTEVIDLASSAGLKVNQVKEILAGQIAIAKKLKGLY